MPTGRQKSKRLDAKASAIEMHISADVEKVFVWFGRQGKAPLCCVFKNRLTLWEENVSLRHD